MNDLESHVLRLIGENLTTPDVFADTDAGMAPIRDWLNDAIAELCMVTGHYRKKYHLAMMEERSIYRLAPQNDYLGWVITAWDRANHRPLGQTDISAVADYDPFWIKRNGTPEWYWQMGWEYIGFYPRPGAKGRIIELDCICIPKPYTYDTEPIKLRDQWRAGAVFQAVSNFFASRGDAGRATEYFARYLETAGLMALRPEQYERQYQMGKQGNTWTGVQSTPG